jgi:hypothetical protein
MRGNEEWTIQRNWQHWVHKTHDEDKQNRGAMKNGQSRETANIGYTRYRMKTNKTKTQHRNLRKNEQHGPQAGKVSVHIYW